MVSWCHLSLIHLAEVLGVRCDARGGENHVCHPQLIKNRVRLKRNKSIGLFKVLLPHLSGPIMPFKVAFVSFCL